MEAMLILTPNSVPSMRSRVFSTSWKNLAFQGFYFSHKLYQKQPPKRCSIIKSNASGHFAAKKIKTLADFNIKEMSRHSLKEFPWKEAKDIVMDRSMSLSKEALKWSIIGLFIISFSSDVALAILRDRELLIPVGLFIGVKLADFLKEFLQEFLHFSKQDDSFKLLLGIGSLFMLVKLISLPLKLQGKVMFSQIGNGGLMQVLWLARNLRQAEEENQNEQLLDASQ